MKRRSSWDEGSPPLAWPVHHNDDMEIVVPPLQSLMALTAPAVKNQPPLTPAPRVIDVAAEVMFLVKISPLSPSTDAKKILSDALDHSGEPWKLEFNMKGPKFEFRIIVADVVWAEAVADTPKEAERRAFQRTVSRILNSDYCLISEGKLWLYCTADDAPGGSFRYDLRCREKRLPHDQVPICDSCTGRGHLRRFCILPEGVPEHQPLQELKVMVHEALDRAASTPSSLGSPVASSDLAIHNRPSDTLTCDSHTKDSGANAGETDAPKQKRRKERPSQPSDIPVVTPAHSSIPSHVTPRPTQRAARPAFEERYNASDQFLGCLHKGSITSEYETAQLTQKLKQLVPRLKNFPDIKPLVKEMVKAETKTSQIKITSSVCVAFLRCTYVNHLSVYLQRPVTAKPHKGLVELFELYVESVCVGKSSCKPEQAMSVLVRDLLVRLFTMPFTVVDGLMKWTIHAPATPSEGKSTVAAVPAANVVTAVLASVPAAAGNATVPAVPDRVSRAYTADPDLDDIQHADQIWYDKLLITEGPSSSARYLPPVVKDDEGFLTQKLSSFFEVLKNDSKLLGYQKLVHFLLAAATEYGVEVTFGACNGSQSVGGCLWLDSVMAETASFGSPRVLVHSLVHVLVNKFFQRLKMNKPFRLIDCLLYFKLGYN